MAKSKYHMLQSFDPITLSGGKTCRVIRHIGSGGQGEIYEAHLDADDKHPLALKWYYPEFATEVQRQLLNRLVSRGSPSNKFLWPQAVTTDAHKGLGYVMPLRGAQFHSLNSLMMRKINPAFYSLITAAYHLTTAFSELHANGLCYQDISLGNAFLNPDTGDILVCDNDNVGVVNGETARAIGTPKFMAPELVSGTQQAPNVEADLYSLSVLLFHILAFSHPMDGAREASKACLDIAALRSLYGTHPIFVFDPKDESNRPLPDIHRNAWVYWHLYPGFIRDLFTRAFTDGIKSPAARVRETEWRIALLRLRDSLVSCPNCYAENFYDRARCKPATNAIGDCWKCKQTLLAPLRVRLGNQVVMLYEQTVLYGHHFGHTLDVSKPFALVVPSEADSGVWGLKNLTQMKWSVELPDGVGEVLPGQIMPFMQNAKIKFTPELEGEFRQ